MNKYYKNPADPGFIDNINQYFSFKKIVIYWTNTFPSLGKWPLFYYSDLTQQDLFSLLKFDNSLLMGTMKIGLFRAYSDPFLFPSKNINIDNTTIWCHHT